MRTFFSTLALATVAAAVSLRQLDTADSGASLVYDNDNPLGHYSDEEFYFWIDMDVMSPEFD